MGPTDTPSYTPSYTPSSVTSSTGIALDEQPSYADRAAFSAFTVSEFPTAREFPTAFPASDQAGEQNDFKQGFLAAFGDEGGAEQGTRA